MRGTKVPRDALQVHFGRILLGERIQFSARSSEGCGLLGKIMAKLCSKMKGICRGDASETDGGVAGRKGPLQLSQSLPRQTFGENDDYFAPQFFIGRCRCNKIFPEALIETYGMQFVGGHIP